MKIARIETFLFDPGTAKNLLFCRVETDERPSMAGARPTSPPARNRSSSTCCATSQNT